MWTKDLRTVTGTQICVRRGGTGPTLLFLHGAGGSANALAFLEGLTDRFTVLVPDHPAFGESEDPPWLDTIHDAAYFYLDLMAALDLKAVHLVGSSLGGWLALEIAVRSTARLASLTVMGAAGLNLKDVRKGDIFMWEPPQRIRNMIHDPALAERILAIAPSEEQAAIAVRNEFATARLAWEPRFFDPHLHKWLHRIDVPTHVIWGEHDRVFPMPYGENLHKHLSGSRFSVIRDCGHLPHVEAPEHLRALITSFISAPTGVAA